MKIRNLAVLGGLMLGAGAATVACSGDDDDNTSPTLDAAVVADTGTPKLDASAPDAAAALPNHLAIYGFVQLVVMDQFTKEPNLLSYFGPNTVQGHSPSLDDVEECLAYQFGAVLGNGDSYPPVGADGGTLLASGYNCRESMSAIHQPLFIPGPIFGQFISSILAEAAAQTPPLTFTVQQTNEILGLESMIVDPTAPDAALPYDWQLEAGPDAGDAGDAGDGGG